MQLRTVTVAVALLAVTATTAAAQPVPTGPITNGDFETGAVPEPIAGAVAGTPASDACVGIGHQVFWGDDSPQHLLLGDEQDPEPQPDGPGALVGAYADGDRDPAEDAAEQSGVDHCVFSEKEGKDAVWLTRQGRTRGAAGWSTALGPESATTFEFAADEDPFDREAVVQPLPSKSDHNLWQVQDQQKAYTENFDELRFQLESDSAVPGPAHIEVGFSLSPGYAQHPFVGLFWEGGLNFRSDDLAPDEDGRVHLDPVADSVADGDIACPKIGGEPYIPCDRYRENVTQAYEAGDLEGVRDLLGQARIVQVSFWGFNHGDGPVVIDEVEIVGATTQAEELAEGNVNLNPMPEQLES